MARAVGRLAALGLTVLAACPRSAADEGSFDEEAVVADLVASRGWSREAAALHVAEVRRVIVEHQPPPPSRARETHLLRSARARLWLRAVFEPAHGADDIPEDDPELRRVRTDPRLVHAGPTVEICQIIVRGPEREAPADGAWWRQAAQLMQQIERHARRLVPSGHRDACPLLRDLQRFVPKPPPTHTTSFEAGGFELGRCEVRGSDGSCKEPGLAPEWEGPVSRAAAPGFLDPIRTRFGLHLVYLHAIHPPAPAGDAEVQRNLARLALPGFRARAFEAERRRLRERAVIRVATREAPARD